MLCVTIQLKLSNKWSSFKSVKVKYTMEQSELETGYWAMLFSGAITSSSGDSWLYKTRHALKWNDGIVIKWLEEKC